MKLTDKISISFAAYGLVFGAILGVTVTVAFYVVEDAILDNFLARAADQVRDSAWMNQSVPLPRGMTLLTDDAPPEFAELPEGHHEVAQYRHVAVFSHPVSGAPMYLVLDVTAAGLDVILSRILFGTLVAFVVAVVVGVLISRIVSQQLMRRMNTLVSRIEGLDLADPKLEPLPKGDEIGFLSEQFSAVIALLREHDRRERDFTRFASHELRSPITVLAGTTSILKSEDGLSDRSIRALARSEAAVERMSRLVDAFLFLGRSKDEPSPATITSTDIADEVRRLAEAQAESGTAIDLQMVANEGSFVSNPQLLSIVLENLIANAARHGRGDLKVEIRPPEIVLSNSIADTPDPGHGFGLEIAERICERLHIDLAIQADGGQYAVTLAVKGPLAG